MIYFVAPYGKDTNKGTLESPWATINHGAKNIKSGDTLYIRDGEYFIAEPIIPLNCGDENGLITYSAYLNEKVVIDASQINFYKDREKYRFRTDTGAFHIENVSHICVRNLKVINSHGHGIAIRDSSHIQINNCTTENTFGCGISIWDTDHCGNHSSYNHIVGNTVIKANTWDMLPQGMKKGNEPPHEAISVAGGSHFEVAFNHVYNCDKEGIDVKEVSKHGRVHHNYVHDLDRQGLYADAWFGTIEDVEFYENIVTDCRGAGLAISVEGGDFVEHVRIYNNLIYNNLGSGILFGIWGDNALRKNIEINNNIVIRNGHGIPAHGQEVFWITGGLCMLSANVEDTNIYNNIFSDNMGFAIGYADAYLKEGADIETVLNKKRINIRDNIIHDNNEIKYPFSMGWLGNYSNMYSYKGRDYVEENPQFNFRKSELLSYWGDLIQGSKR